MLRAAGLDVRAVLGHPVFLVTAIASVIGWWTAFIGQVITELKWQQAGFAGSAVGVEWFGIVLQFGIIVRVLWVVASDSVVAARFQLSIFFGVSLVFSVLGINYGIYAPTSYVKAMGAGWFMMTMANIVWLLYFSSEEDSVILRLLDSVASQNFSRSNNTASSRRPQRSPAGNGSISGNNNNSSYQSQQQQQQQQQENISYSNSGLGLSTGKSGGSMNNEQNDLNEGSLGGHADFETATGAEYTLKARALYAYNASPDDPNEISFSKGEILSIVDNSGKWWQARKDDGTKGIIPSNYVVLC